jgi:hypothetical protein
MATRTNTRTRVSGKKRAKTPVSKGVSRSKEASLKVAYEVEVNKTEVQTLAVVEGNRGKLKDDKDYNTKNEDDSTELDHAEKENRCESHSKSTSPTKKQKKSSLDANARQWKDRATRAERQLKSIANTRVINSFQEGEVRQYAKQVLWKKVKFITCDGTMVRCMKEAARAFEVPEDEQEDWMSTYSHTIREAINAQRNHCCQELRKTLISEYQNVWSDALHDPPNTVLSLLWTEMKNQQHDGYVDDVTKYANVRANNLQDDFLSFWTFFDKFVPCVSGVKIWSTKVKIARTITESGCVTITDEAFTILALENYWDRWFHNKPALWTDSRRGNQQFMGWSDEAYNRYDDACKLIQKQRATESSRSLEREFKSKARNTYANGRVVSRTDTTREQQRVVFDELEME